MVVEDLHWLDASTLELQQLLAEQGATAPLMLLYTARPEFHPPWPMRTHHSQITLNRLSSRNVREMIALVAARKALASESVEAVVERTGGVPLFVEELTRTVLDGSSSRITGRQIPATLHDSLMARLDRLGPAKEVIQIGAVIGSEFSYGLLHAVYPIPDEDLRRAIYIATDAELVYVRGIPPDASYRFKHALIRDTAYEALLRNRRKELHSRIAEVLVREFPDRVTSAPELLAHHYTEAGLIEQAITHWQRAGQQAIGRSANTEAISHFTKGLELLKLMPDYPERTQQELTLQIALGGSLQATKGYAAPEVERVYTRARELCRQSGQTSVPVLFGLWRFYLQRGELKAAREIAEQCLGVAERGRDPTGLLRAHNTLGVTLFFLGELHTALEHLNDGINLCTPQLLRSSIFVQDPMVVCLSYASWALWHLGYADQALRRSQESIALARARSHPYTLATALFFAAELHHLRVEVQEVQSHADETIAISTEHRFPFWLAQATSLRGWALAEQGREEEGISEVREGLALYTTTGAELGRAYWLVLPVPIYARRGDIEQPLRLLAEALTMMHKTGERYYEAEIYRVKGELLLQPDHSRVAEAWSCFNRAVDAARHMKAKSLELRARMSLARLIAGEGHRDEAHAMVSEIYTWFTEGFDTADLKEGKALLDELTA
jgi:predicted ATPase